MSTKRMLLTALAASAVLLALGIGSQLAGAQPPAQQPTPPGASIPYPGRLTDARGQPVPDGTYDFTFTLHDAETGGASLWSETQTGVAVQGGAFQALLGAARPIPPAALTGSKLWLEVAVRGLGEAAFTALAPRQRLSAAAPTAPDSASAPPSCPHDHFGETWSGGSANPGLKVSNSGNGPAVWGEKTTGSPGSVAAVYGTATTNFGVWGYSESGRGVYGSSLNGDGVHGYGWNHHGVYGETGGDWGNRSGVYGLAVNNNAHGVTGWNTSAGPGVYGRSVSGNGVRGHSEGSGNGVYGYSASGNGVYGYSASSYAGYFNGPARVIGYLTKSGGGFEIDHPLDPENKYLYHSFVESPDMKNVYDGVVVLDTNGEGWVELPAWFESLNKDFRYQLTPIGAPGPNLYIAQEIQNNRFQIAGGTPGMKVSWQVTGIRHDPYAEAHPLPVEEDKPAEERGTYLHPVEHGQPETSGLDYRQNQGPATGGGG